MTDGRAKPWSGSGHLWVVCACLAAAVALAYAGVVHNGFVYYDDNDYVTENHFVRQGLTWEGIRWALTSFEANNWHPVTWLSHMADVQAFGMRPAGHHLVSLAWHITSVLVLFGLLRYMTGRLWASAFVAALFGLHPLHVESVAWVAERKDVLSVFFWLATMWAYAWYARGPGAWKYLLVMVLFALGLGAKPMLVSLPPVLLIIDYWPLGRFGREKVGRLVLEKVPLFVMAAVSAVVTLAAQRSAIIPTAHDSIPARLSNAAISYCTYLWQMLWPANLAAFYPHPQQPAYVLGAVCAMVLLVISIVCIRAGQGRGYLAAGWVWYLVTLVPVIGLVQVGQQAHADRYTYIPLTGVFIAAVWTVGDWVAARLRLRARVAAVVGICIIATLMEGTFRQVGYWKDDLSLFGHAVKAVPDNYLMKMKLADAYVNAGRYDDAQREAEESLAIRELPNTYGVLGGVWQARGDVAKAYECYGRALSLDPTLKATALNIGAVALQMGRLDEAESRLRRAVELDPWWPDGYALLGQAQAANGRLDEAVRSLTRAIAMDPGRAGSHVALARVYARQGNQAASLAEARRAVELVPDDPRAREFLRQMGGGGQ